MPKIGEGCPSFRLHTVPGNCVAWRCLPQVADRCRNEALAATGCRPCMHPRTGGNRPRHSPLQTAADGIRGPGQNKKSAHPDRTLPLRSLCPFLFAKGLGWQTVLSRSEACRLDIVLCLTDWGQKVKHRPQPLLCVLCGPPADPPPPSSGRMTLWICATFMNTYGRQTRWRKNGLWSKIFSGLLWDSNIPTSVPYSRAPVWGLQLAIYMCLLLRPERLSFTA